MSRPKLAYKLDVIKEWRNDVGSCVYKLSYGKAYVIVKAKILVGSLKQIQKSLNQYAHGSAGQHSKKSLYWKFFGYVTSHPNSKWKVQLLLVSDNPYKLLKAEQHYAKKSKKDKNGMNVYSGAYICKWNPELGMNNWLPKNAVLNYKRYIDKPYIEPAKKSHA